MTQQLHSMRSLPKRNENTCLYKNLHANDYGNIIHNSPKPQAIQVFIRLVIDKETQCGIAI